MKLDCGKRTRRQFARSQYLANWHPWFAWFPVRVGPCDCRWWEMVERKITWCNIGTELWTYKTYRQRAPQQKTIDFP